MKKRSYKQEINEINAILKNSPTLNEALSFEDDFDGMDYEEEMPMEEPMHDDGMGCNSEGGEIIKTIWKTALKGMNALAETESTDDPCYEVFKKIWQICDKVITETKNPQQMNK
jgi:hypothetical protein